MIHFIGDGQHARVCREVIANRKRIENSRSLTYWFVAIGDNVQRREEAIAQGGPFATLIHRRTIISPTASVDHGSVVMAGVVIQCGAKIGKHVILNTGCTVDHDCVIGDYAHIAPGAHLCGSVVVGEGALIGVGVGIEPNVFIPEWSIVKRGPYEIKSIQSN